MRVQELIERFVIEFRLNEKFEVIRGTLITTYNEPCAVGSLISCAGALFPVDTSGIFAPDVRADFSLKNGSKVFLAMKGKAVFNEDALAKMMSAEQLSNDDVYFWLSIFMETTTDYLSWCNERVFMGQMSELRAPIEREGFMKFRIYDINDEACHFPF
jgi:hypothetical protein